MGHPAQSAQLLMPVEPESAVHLGHRLEAARPEDVAQEPDLHGVAGKEGQRPEQLSGRPELPGQRLDEAVQFRKKTLSKGLAASSVTRPPPSATDVSPLTNGRR